MIKGVIDLDQSLENLFGTMTEKDFFQEKTAQKLWYINNGKPD